MADNEQDSGLEGWTVYRKLILAELERQGKRLDSLDSKIDARIDSVNLKIDLKTAELGAKIDSLQITEIRKMWNEITALKVKAAIWGAGASAGVSIIIGIIIWLLNKGH